MKLGILGTGMIVREFLPWLAGPDCPFTVQALCSTQRSAPVADEMCEQYGIPQRTTNYFELLQWVDVIYLAVPNLQHYRYAKVALEAGKHVIVEKPMACCTAAQTEELAALARRKKVFLFEAMTTQYLENYNKIRGAAAPHRHGEAGAVQLQPVFQPVRCLLCRGNAGLL